MILWTNFKVGIARGFGVTIGMSLVLAVFVWVLTTLVNLPLIGAYFKQAEAHIRELCRKDKLHGRV